MKSTTKNILITKIANDTMYSEEIVSEILESFMKTVKDEVASGKVVSLRKFGNFKPRFKKATTARDIRRNKILQVPARYAAYFKASKYFDNQVSQLIHKNESN